MPGQLGAERTAGECGAAGPVELRPLHAPHQRPGADQVGQEPECGDRGHQHDDRVPGRGVPPPHVERVETEERPCLGADQGGGEGERERLSGPAVEVAEDRQERERGQDALGFTARDAGEELRCREDPTRGQRRGDGGRAAIATGEPERENAAHRHRHETAGSGDQQP